MILWIVNFIFCDDFYVNIDDLFKVKHDVNGWNINVYDVKKKKCFIMKCQTFTL